MSSDFFKDYRSGARGFQVREEGFDNDRQAFYETLLSLGNGFMGSRSIYEENTPGSSPGTYIVGIFDKSGAQVEELVNLPNPVSMMIAVDGEKFDAVTMKVISNKRMLDMKNGVLIRKTVFQDAKKRRFIYQSARFLSMDDPHIGAMKVSLKLIKGSARLTMVDGLDDSVFNSGGLMLSKRRHFDTLRAERQDVMNYTAFSTHSFKNIIAYGDHVSVELGGKTQVLSDRIHNFELKTGHEITFTKIFSIYTSHDSPGRSIRNITIPTLESAVKAGFGELFRRHKAALAERWYDCDVAIKGDPESQLALRLNIYHVFACARREYSHFSVGAKSLSGPGYRGHIFWDTEIYILPFLARTEPETARGMLLFRHDTLPLAKENAKENGYRGAMYPWETTASGTEQTPRYTKEIDGSIVEVRTMDFEHHITADVAYGIYDYFRVTDDRDFLFRYGAEIVFETARFWAARSEFDPADGMYHIRGVIGPDEFHIDVDDNAYTNCMAAWNLEYASDLFEKYQSEPAVKKIISHIGLTEEESKKWREISGKFAILRSKKYGVMKQFAGYMRCRDVPISGYDRYFMPLAPRRYEGIEELMKTKFIKQSDVLLVFRLLPERFTAAFKKRNYDYYLPRTLHKSSLSYCMHSILAAELGDRFRAFAFFWAAVNIDLYDIAGNTSDGMHAANLGGVWQAAVIGFGGLNCGDEGVSINPRLPGNFETMSYRFMYRGCRYEVEASHSQVKLRFIPSGRGGCSASAVVFGKQVKLVPGRFRTVKKQGGGGMIIVKDILKPENNVTVSKDVPVGRVGEIIIKRKASSLPVVDGDNKLLGLISEKNIIKATMDDNFKQLTAGDIMETAVVSLKWSDSLETATKVFTGKPYRRLPVLKDGKVIGVLTRRDIIADFLGGYY